MGELRHKPSSHRADCPGPPLCQTVSRVKLYSALTAGGRVGKRQRPLQLSRLLTAYRPSAHFSKHTGRPQVYHGEVYRPTLCQCPNPWLLWLATALMGASTSRTVSVTISLSCARRMGFQHCVGGNVALSEGAVHICNPNIVGSGTRDYQNSIQG